LRRCGFRWARAAASAAASAAARDVEAIGGPASIADDVHAEEVAAVGRSVRWLLLELDEASSSTALKSKLLVFKRFKNYYTLSSQNTISMLTVYALSAER